MTAAMENRRPEASHIWDREKHEHYVEPLWVGRRLFEVERFEGEVCDPCCGFGNMLAGAEAAGLRTVGYDLVNRGAPQLKATRDFLQSSDEADNFGFNPPFELGEEFAVHALRLARSKVAMVYPTRRLNAAGKWLRRLPLFRLWYLTPRPSMPPGHEYLRMLQAGENPSGGKQDFCILVFLKGFEGRWTGDWLHRDGGQQ